MNSQYLKSVKLTVRYGTWGELANLLHILNELLIMVIWLITLTEKRIGWGEGFLALGLIYFVSYVLSRFLHSVKLKISLERIIFLIWIFSALYWSARFLLFEKIHMSLAQFLPLVFTSEISSEATHLFWILMFSALVILHGVRSARHPISTVIMVNSVRWIIVIYAIYAVIFGRFQIDAFLPSFFIFLLSSILGLSLSRITDLSEEHGGRLPGFTWQRAAGIGGVALAVILLCLLFSLAIDLDVAKIAGKGLTLLVQMISGVFVVVMSPILYVVIAIFQFIYKLLAPNLQNVIEPQELLTGEQYLEELQQEVGDVSRIDPRLFVMIGVIVTLIIIAVIQLKWQPWRRQILAEEDTAQIENSEKKKSVLTNLIPGYLKPRKKASAKSLFAAARIRYTYAQLMDLCERLGKPRPRCITPLEFLPLMVGVFPLYHSDLEVITNAYNKIRYGELPETDEEVEAVLTAWRRISEFSKENLEEPKKKFLRKGR